MRSQPLEAPRIRGEDRVAAAGGRGDHDRIDDRRAGEHGDRLTGRSRQRLVHGLDENVATDVVTNIAPTAPPLGDHRRRDGHGPSPGDGRADEPKGSVMPTLEGHERVSSVSPSVTRPADADARPEMRP